MKSINLPVKNESGNYEIRLESIGGLGANLCGKMLGELAVKYLGLNSVSFSSYGSEKTGTPVKGYIRYSESDKEIRVHSPVKNPHLLCIFHDALMSNAQVFKGCDTNTEIIINTVMSEKEIKNTLLKNNVQEKNVYCISGQKIAIETHSRINVVMLGAMAKVMGFVEIDDVIKICEDALGRKYPDALSSNLEGIKRGYDEVTVLKETITSETEKNITDKNKNESDNEEPEWGYATAPIGGINPRFGSTVVNDLSPSRQGYIPVFIPERCINCGLCDSTCPDMVFQFSEGEYNGKKMMVNKGLDHYHCKGCLRCVSVCPVQALVKGLESEHQEKKWFLPNQDLLRTPEYYEKTGSDGYITSESYLTEKRIEGGEV